MPSFVIDSPDDPRLSAFAALPGRGRASTVIVEGEIALMRALESGHPIDAVLLGPSQHARLAGQLPAALPVYEAERSILQQVVGFDFHRGCLAAMPRPRARSIEALDEGDGVVVVAEGVADPANLGAMIRNARGFGARALVHGGGADPWSRRAIRAAMGLGFTLPILEPSDLPAAVARLRPRARVIAAVVGEGGVPLSEYRAPARAVLLLGNEGAGLSDELRALADDRVTIPLAPDVDSLNVAAATAVLLWGLRSGSPPGA